MGTEKRSDTEEVEIWKDIPGFEGYYQISNLGRILSYERKVSNQFGYYVIPSKERKPVIAKNFYKSIVLYKGGKEYRYYLHRLVLLTFIGPAGSEKSDGMHIDDDPSNCRLDNLRWGTRTENIRDCVNKGRFKHNFIGKFGAAHHRSKPINQYTISGELLNEFEGIADAARITGICVATIFRAVKKRRPTNGFLWNYSSEGMPEIAAIEKRKTSRTVNKYSLSGVYIEQFDTIKSAALSCNRSSGAIVSCCRGKDKTAGGFKWRYAE